MKKILLCALAISLGSIAFAEEPWYCQRFSPPQWSINLRGCKSCPVRDTYGTLIKCTNTNNKKCCWDVPPFQTSQGRYSCTTDHFVGLYSSPECEQFFNGIGNGKGNNEKGAGNTPKNQPRNAEKPAKSVKPAKVTNKNAKSAPRTATPQKADNNKAENSKQVAK